MNSIQILNICYYIFNERNSLFSPEDSIEFCEYKNLDIFEEPLQEGYTIITYLLNSQNSKLKKHNKNENFGYLLDCGRVLQKTHEFPTGNSSLKKEKIFLYLNTLYKVFKRKYNGKETRFRTPTNMPWQFWSGYHFDTVCIVKKKKVHCGLQI